MPSPAPEPPGPVPACRTVISCGSACRMGLSGSAVRMPMSGRQMLSTSAAISTPQPAVLSHGWLSNSLFMCFLPLGKRGFPLENVRFVRMFKTSLKRTNKPHSSPRFRAGNCPAFGWSVDIRF